jgi:aspartate/methionine/tyrosine aminotransferase
MTGMTSSARPLLDAEHVPLATFPGMRERTVTISSSGKTFSFTGWKVGWVKAFSPTYFPSSAGFRSWCTASSLS